MSKKRNKSFSDMADQLKAWSQTQDELPDAEAPPPAAPTTAEGPPEEVVLSDEELFAQAVNAVGDGAVLKKFDDEDVPRKKPPAAASPRDGSDAASPPLGDHSGASDARLFLDAVDDVNPDNFKKNKS